MTGGQFARFTYDNYHPTLWVIPRVILHLDYSPYGEPYHTADPAQTGNPSPQFTMPVNAATTNIGGGDFIHGEGGDDTLYGMSGTDTLFGDGQDDDIYGNAGWDWISGGTGVDGIVGDDGLLSTSRNGQTETMWGVTTANLQSVIAIPGDNQSAVIYVTGELRKEADLVPFYVGHNDIAYGGLGNDFIHGGTGDDALSGAEALALYYDNGRDPIGVLASIIAAMNAIPTLAWRYELGDMLRFDRPGTGSSGQALEFDAYDENDPWRKILLINQAGQLVTLPGFSTPANPLDFFMNFRNTSTVVGFVEDGKDTIFGDSGDDWIVGGTGADRLWGGFGDDYLSADDDLNSIPDDPNDTYANDSSDVPPNPYATYADMAYGGAGRDVLVASTTLDRLIDWMGEQNSFITGFNPFGIGTVARLVSPGLVAWLTQLSRVDGADRTRGSNESPSNDERFGEPFGEAAIVTQEDPFWGDQNGGPADPQPGHDAGGRDNATDPLPMPAQPTVTVSSVSVAEGASGTTLVTLLLTLNFVPTEPVSVDFATLNGSALAGSDYLAASGTIVLGVGRLTTTLTLTVFGDLDTEANETFTVQFTNGNRVLIGTSSATVTIVNDDTGVLVTPAATDANGSEQGPDPLVFTVTRTGPATSALIVNVSWTGTAASSDYNVAVSGGTLSADRSTLTIAAGSFVATLTITPVNDTVFEPTESVTLTVLAGTGYTANAASAAGNIADNDVGISVAPFDATGAEPGSDVIVFTVTRSGPTTGTTTVNLTWTGTATLTTDYTVGFSGTGISMAANRLTLTFAAGATTATLTLTPVDDNVFEGTETATLTIVSGTGYTVVSPASASGTVADNEVAPTVSAAVTDGTGSETAGDPIVFTVTRSGTTTGTTTVNLTWTGTATLTSDYTVAVSGTGVTISTDRLTLTFAAGATTATLTITPVNDTVVDINETVIMTIVAGTGYTVGASASATGTIADNDTAISVAATDGTGSETVGDPIVFTVTRSGITTGTTTVNLTWTGTATLTTDYTVAVSGANVTISTNRLTLTFAPGATTATLTITPVDDAIIEGPESLTMTIASGTGYTVGTPSTASATISDNDFPPSVSAAVTDGTGSEAPGDPIVFTVSRSGITTGTSSVNLTWTGTATLTTDYTVAVSGTGVTLSTDRLTLTFAAGATTATLTITPVNDTAVEGPESLTMTIASGTGYTVGSPSAATGTVNDNDVAISTVVTDGAGSETAGDAIVFTVTRSGSTTGTTTVNLTWTGAATRVTDYAVAASGTGVSLSADNLTLTFVAGRRNSHAHVDASGRLRGGGSRVGDDDDRIGQRLHGGCAIVGHSGMT